MTFKDFWLSLSADERKDLAERCETSVGHLSNIAYDCKTCSEFLAVAIERETRGAVLVEGLCPKVDWAYIRGSSRAKTKSLRVG